MENTLLEYLQVLNFTRSKGGGDPIHERYLDVLDILWDRLTELEQTTVTQIVREYNKS